MLSRKTLGLMIRLLDQFMYRSQIDQLFYELEVPERFLVGASKLKLLQNVVRGLEYIQEEDLLIEMVSEAIKQLPEEPAEELKDVLIKDGFVIGDEGITEDVPVAEDTRTSLEILVNRNSEYLDVDTLNHHLAENLDLFKQEKWDSAIGHARNFVEQLLKDIAKAMAGERNESPKLGRPVKVREYLQQCGFFDEAERQKLVDGVYGYFSEEGSHPGISEQSTARVCMHILWAFAYYVLEKFEDMKQRNAW